VCDDYAGLAHQRGAGDADRRRRIRLGHHAVPPNDRGTLGGLRDDRSVPRRRPTQWMKVAGMAEAFNLRCQPRHSGDAPASDRRGAERLTVEYMPWMLKLYQETPAIEKGQLVLPNKPGLG